MLLFYCQNPVFSTYVPFLSCWVQSSTMCYQCISPVCLYCRFQDVAQCPSPKLPAPGTVHCGYCVTVRCPVQQLIRSSVKEFKAWRHKQWGTEKCGFQTTLFTVMRKKKNAFFFFSVLRCISQLKWPLIFHKLLSLSPIPEVNIHDAKSKFQHSVTPTPQKNQLLGKKTVTLSSFGSPISHYHRLSLKKLKREGMSSRGT